MSSPNENSDESMPTFNSAVEGSQNASLDKSLSPIESPEVPPSEGSMEFPSPEEVSPEEVSPEDVSPKEVSPEDVSPEEVSPEDVSPEDVSPEEEVVPSEEGEPLEEPVVSESKQMDKDKKMVDEAGSFRRKLTNTKKRLPTMDDHQKDEIRNGVINEFINILKISKRATTRKKLGRRINNLRNVFNETLDLLNGTAKKRPRKRKTKKQQTEAPPAESFSENQP
jgi:hypothetical protein